MKMQMFQNGDKITFQIAICDLEDQDCRTICGAIGFLLSESPLTLHFFDL